MLLGYLTKEGHLVAVDTMRKRTLFKAYRVDTERREFSFLTLQRPMEDLGEVRVTVHLHRQGWTAPGEVVLKRTTARLYRTKTSHLLVGPTWKAIRGARSGEIQTEYTPPVSRPFLSRMKPITKPRGIFPPPRGARFVGVLHDRSVKACLRAGATVHLYATEQKEFTDFVLGKMQATIEFPSAEEAEAFARNFPRVTDPRSLDANVRTNIERSRKVVASRTWTLAVAAVAGLAIATVVILVAVANANPSLLRPAGWVMSAVLTVAGITAIAARRGQRREIMDLKAKWPKEALEKWIQEVQAHAGGFPFLAKELGVELDPEAGDLAPLDRYLRSLPADSFMGVMALDAAAYVGAMLLIAIGRQVDSRWRYQPETGEVVLSFDSINTWISPLYQVRRIWEDKDPQTLDEFVREWSRKVQLYYAFSAIPELVALGFLRAADEDVDRFLETVMKPVEAAPATSHIMGENHYRARRGPFGAFELLYAEIEIEHRLGPAFIPLVAVPSCAPAQRVTARLDGPSPRSPAREDVAVVRLDGYEMVPLGVQIRNYLDIGPGLASVKGAIDIDLLTVAEEAQVVTPRMRETRPEAKDGLGPLDVTPEGVPTNPYGRFLGRVSSVGEVTNPLTNIPLWRLRLDLGGFPLDVVVRKDRCDGQPEVGHSLNGSCWLLGDLHIDVARDASYIR